MSGVCQDDRPRNPGRAGYPGDLLPNSPRGCGLGGFWRGCGMSVNIITGDCRDVLRGMDAGSVQCCVTSPPYFGLRDYGMPDQIGLEPTPDEFVAAMVAVFGDVRRVLRDDGTCWLNIGDSYAGGGGHSPNAPSSATSKSGKYGDALKSGGIKPQGSIKPKDLIGIPWRVAFALQADGWYLRQEIIWHKPNPMPESVTDRCTKAHESMFLLSKSPRYFFDAAAIAEKSEGRELFGNSRSKGYCEQRQDNSRRDMTPTETRNRRSVWTIATQPFSGAHFATMPPELAETCIKAGTKPGDMVLDPFGGAGTTGLVADRLQRNATLIELNPAYAAIARDRITGDASLFAEVSA
jgi:DNA modification methylase